MTAKNSTLMQVLNGEQYNSAVSEWRNCCKSYLTIKNLIPTNYIFNLSLDQVDWLKQKNKNQNFCVDIGVFNNQLVMILCPLDEKGQKVPVEGYPYSILCELSNDLALVETQEYTVIKNALLSKDLRKIDNDSDMYFPVANKPLMEQDKAVDAIEMWRDQGMDWFYRECSDFSGERIFQKFYVPSYNLTPPKEGLTNFVCSFGLKYSDIYQRMLVTLIFISFYENLRDTGGSVETISNTYDWSQPCPPFC